jgi:hypothetical protein
MDYSTQPGKRKVPHSLPSEYGTFLNRIGNYFDHFLRFDYTKPAAVIEAPGGDKKVSKIKMENMSIFLSPHRASVDTEPVIL